MTVETITLTSAMAAAQVVSAMSTEPVTLVSAMQPQLDLASPMLPTLSLTSGFFIED